MVLHKYSSCKFKLQEEVGCGAFAQVYKVQRKRARQAKKGKNFALKVVNKGKLEGKMREQILEEIRIQRELRVCGNVLTLFRVYECKLNLYLLLEYEEGGTLRSKIEDNSLYKEEDAKIICA